MCSEVAAQSDQCSSVLEGTAAAHSELWRQRRRQGPQLAKAAAVVLTTSEVSSLGS